MIVLSYGSTKWTHKIIENIFAQNLNMDVHSSPNMETIYVPINPSEQNVVYP